MQQSPSPTTGPLTPETTLSAIALRSDACATVLDRYKLDFCCRGRRSLLEACRAVGLDVERVLAELATETTARQEARGADADWQTRITNTRARRWPASRRWSARSPASTAIAIRSWRASPPPSTSWPTTWFRTC
jgi:hypothetical protein